MDADDASSHQSDRDGWQIKLPIVHQVRLIYREDTFQWFMNDVDHETRLDLSSTLWKKGAHHSRINNVSRIDRDGERVRGSTDWLFTFVERAREHILPWTKLKLSSLEYCVNILEAFFSRLENHQKVHHRRVCLLICLPSSRSWLDQSSNRGKRDL